MLRRLLLGIFMVTLLAACGSIETRQKPGSTFTFEAHAHIPAEVRALLMDAPLCCTSLARLQFENISKAGERAARIDANAPAYAFASGKSFFAAYRIADLPRPFIARVASQRTAEPNSLGRLIPELRQLVFAPAILILDAQFTVRRRIEPGPPSSACANNPHEDVYSARTLVSEPPAEAAYLVVVTTDQLMSRDGDPVCGIIRHGLSPIGNITVDIASLGFVDGAIRLEGPADWFPETRRGQDVGLLAGMLAESGLLLLGDNAIHYLEPKQHHFAERLNIPYRQVITAKTSGRSYQQDRYLSIRVLDTASGETRHHTFQMQTAPPSAFVPASRFVDLIAPRITPAVQRDMFGFFVTRSSPSIDFESPGRGAIARIGETAVAGGMVTAFPCALCQTGACTPEMLAPCAALFSIGALIGGLAGAGSELAAGMSRDANSVPDITGTVDRSLKPLLEAGSRQQFGPSMLTQCLMEQVSTSGSWIDQGREVRPVVPAATDLPDREAPVIPGSPVAPAYRYATTASVSRIALVAAGKAGQAPAEVPVNLVIEGSLRIVELPDKEMGRMKIRWQGMQRPLGDWVARGSEIAGASFQEGCRELAKQIVETSRHAWNND
jgi:hypothetical protein